MLFAGGTRFQRRPAYQETHIAKVRGLVTTEVKSCREYSSPNRAAQLTWDHEVRCAPIVDQENRVIGTLTDRNTELRAMSDGPSGARVDLP